MTLRRCFIGITLFLVQASTQLTFPSRLNDNGICSTPERRQGTCINIKQCPKLIQLLQIPLTNENRQYLLSSQCGFDGNVPKVCCEDRVQNQFPTQRPTQRPNQWTTPWTTQRVTQRSTERPGAGQVDDLAAPDVTSHPNIRFLDLNNCGPISDQKIIGGNKTRINEFPWMALLAYSSNGRKPEFRCGGSIINPRYVLTAAHCVTALPSDLKLIGIRVGEHDLTTDIDCDDKGTEDEICAERYQDFGIERVQSHSEYSSKKLHNDIALIRVDQNIDFRPINVKPICLPIGPASKITSKKLVATGWGITEERIRSLQLLKVSLPIFSHTECMEVYKKQAPIWHKQICVGGEIGKDSCGGDSGGPLQAPVANYYGNSHFVQYGIVSFGVRNCGTGGFPGVYTRVDYYLDWILDNMRA
ncbi:hypothetical protein QAD02_005225 [Eretmocerus hayati]|uniref:Uncharacterized protein n=1 Tax=Eretmocerus hayati TaxID=131215 RepID=A0ACC2NSW9_9HYME|nr:hypothetical protein QAD02_005225 [Eretmocerus hayati]